jgi:hypothetical protein
MTSAGTALLLFPAGLLASVQAKHMCNIMATCNLTVNNLQFSDVLIACLQDVAYHSVTAMVGAGVLGLPAALAQLGWAGGIFFLLFSIWVSWYTYKLLVYMHEVILWLAVYSNGGQQRWCSNAKLPAPCSNLPIYIPRQQDQSNRLSTCLIKLRLLLCCCCRCLTWTASMATV